uniref:Lipopolysaccharide cholinephosphotransferase n=1 Tax=Panagrellus redivivus TaxID=6233 RepID=A0A7E4ZVD6_PANRE
MRASWVSKTVLLIIAKYVVIIFSTIIAYHILFAPFHTFTPFSTPTKHVFNRSIDIRWPKHLKSLLIFPASLKLVFIDDPFLTCVVDADQAKKAHACQKLASAETTRIGTYLSIPAFKKVFNSKVLNNTTTNDTWTLEPQTYADALVLKYHYHENFDKYVIINSLEKKNGTNYHLLRGARDLKTIGIRHFTNDKFSLTSTVGVKKCESECYAFLPKELHRHMAYLKAVEMLYCDQNLAKINVLPNATWNIPKKALTVLDDLIDEYIDSNQIPFMCHGTMLGWYRDCGIIPHTTDMDYCIKAEEYVEDFHTKFINHKTHPPMRIIGKAEYGFELTYWLYHDEKGYGPAWVDFFYMYKENATHSWTPLLMDFSRGVRVKDYVALVDKLCTGDIYGHLYFIPCEPLAYLDTRYGETWNKSNPDAGYFEKGVQYAKNGNWNMKQGEYYKSF